MTYRIASTALLTATLCWAHIACSKKDAQNPGPTEQVDVEPAGGSPATAPATDSQPTPSAAPARGDDAQRKSKNGLFETEVGGVPVTVQYGRPEVRGRKLFGNLVPFGQLWRTGADEATTLTLGTNAMLEGRQVPAGTYALFTIPQERTWTVVLNRTAKQWGAYKYDPSQDVVRVDVNPMTKGHTEALTFESDGTALVLRWGTVAVPIKIQSAG